MPIDSSTSLQAPFAVTGYISSIAFAHGEGEDVRIGVGLDAAGSPVIGLVRAGDAPSEAVFDGSPLPLRPELASAEHLDFEGTSLQVPARVYADQLGSALFMLDHPMRPGLAADLDGLSLTGARASRPLVGLVGHVPATHAVDVPAVRTREPGRPPFVAPPLVVELGVGVDGAGHPIVGLLRPEAETDPDGIGRVPRLFVRGACIVLPARPNAGERKIAEPELEPARQGALEHATEHGVEFSARAGGLDFVKIEGRAFEEALGKLPHPLGYGGPAHGRGEDVEPGAESLRPAQQVLASVEVEMERTTRAGETVREKGHLGVGLDGRGPLFGEVMDAGRPYESFSMRCYRLDGYLRLDEMAEQGLVLDAGSSRDRVVVPADQVAKALQNLRDYSRPHEGLSMAGTQLPLGQLNNLDVLEGEQDEDEFDDDPRPVRVGSSSLGAFEEGPVEAAPVPAPPLHAFDGESPFAKGIPLRETFSQLLVTPSSELNAAVEHIMAQDELVATAQSRFNPGSAQGEQLMRACGEARSRAFTVLDEARSNLDQHWPDAQVAATLEFVDASIQRDLDAAGVQLPDSSGRAALVQARRELAQRSYTAMHAEAAAHDQGRTEAGFEL